jgi:hypothetical protein
MSFNKNFEKRNQENFLILVFTTLPFSKDVKRSELEKGWLRKGKRGVKQNSNGSDNTLLNDSVGRISRLGKCRGPEKSHDHKRR